MLLNAESTTRQGGSVLNGQPEQAEETVGWVEQSETHQQQKLNTTNTTTRDSFTYDAQGQTINKNGTPYSWDDEHSLISQGASQYFYGSSQICVLNSVKTMFCHKVVI